MRHRLLLLALPLLLAACGDEPPPAPAPDAAAPALAPPPAPPPPPAPAPAMPVGSDLGMLATTADTLDSLRGRHGVANVVEQGLPVGEGQEEPGWMLFPDAPQRRVAVYLDSLEQPTYLQVQGETSDWSAQGVFLGMTLTELQALNGVAFEFLGFGWDYGGNVSDWHGGSLADRGVTVRLCPPDGETPADYPIGEAPATSDDPRLGSHVPLVCSLGQQIGPTGEV